MLPYSLSPLNVKDLRNFFNQFDFFDETNHTLKYIQIVQELAFCQQVIIHEAFSLIDDEPLGFVALCVTHDEIDNIAGMLVEFVYVKPKYRSVISEFLDTKFSYMILDYTIEIALKLQKNVAINHVYLVPVNEKVRKVYLDYGFENIPGSGKNEYEDFMVFNLLDEDPVLM